MTCAPAGGEFRIVDEVEIEFYVLGREGRAVMPFDVVAQLDAPLQPVLGDTAIGERRDLGCETGTKLPLGSTRQSALNRLKYTPSSTSMWSFSGWKMVGS
jgi:hypothetical protein